MPWTFNPFSGTFDQKGSGGGGGASYIDGEVATYADLPLDGSAALNSAWLVRTASGVWPVSRKQAGIYIRTATGGSSRDADYTYAGTMPDVFSDSQFLLYDNSDSTRNLQFDLGSITTGTTRTLTAPNASGRIQVEGQPIGNTTPAAGTFTTLAANNGTLTASAPVLDLAQTWNAAGVSFVGLRFDVTNTASATGSRVLHFTVGGTNNLLGIYRDASGFSASPRFEIGSSGVAWNIRTRTGGGVGCNFSDIVGLGSSLQFGVGSGTTAGDLILQRDAANIFAQVNGTNAQEFRVYNTFTSATNHERGFLKWSSNVFQIGTEKGSGGGTARNLHFQTDGSTRLYITTGGNIIIGNGDGTTQASSALVWQGNARINATNTLTGVITLGNRDNDGFNRLQFGGTTSSFPALKRSSTVLQSRLADDSDFAPLQGQLRTHANAVTETITADKTLTLYDAAGTAYKVPCVAA
jgi:hypothetical protein